jgi:hypothetical protein
MVKEEKEENKQNVKLFILGNALCLGKYATRARTKTQNS